MDEKIPESVNFSAYMLPVRDCGKYDLDIQHAICGVLEWKYGLHNEYLSPMFLYSLTDDNNVVPIFKWVEKYGVCTEKAFPYISSNYGKEAPGPAYQDAQKYKLVKWNLITRPKDLKISLAKNGPCYAEINVYNNSEKFWTQNVGENLIKKMGICIVGYTKNGFLCRTSKGDQWGINGHFELSIYDFTELSSIYELDVGNATIIKAKRKSCSLF